MPNQAAPVNAPIALWCCSQHAWRRVTELRRSASTILAKPQSEMKTNTLSKSVRQLAITGLFAACIWTELCASTNTAVSDTFINAYQDWGGPGSPGADLNFGNSPYLYCMGSPNRTAYCYPLLNFDLTSLSNQVVLGAPRVEAFIYGGHPSGDGRTRPVSVHQVFIPWDASTVTWNTFGTSAGVQWGTEVGPGLSVQNIIWPGSGPRLISWEIPASVVQDWIDNPASNHGLLLNNQNTSDASDIYFASLENGSYPAPRLVFHTEPRGPFLSIRISEVEVCWTSVTNSTYRVEYRSDLTTNTWATLSNCVASAGTETCIYDKVPRGQPQRLYRVVVTNCVPGL